MQSTFAEHFFLTRNRVKARIFTMLLAKSFFSIGKKSRIIPPFRFWGLSEIQLGNHVIINKNCWTHVVNSKNNLQGPKIIMGDHVGIGMNATISAAKLIVIDENVFTAPNVYISDHGHEYTDINIPIAHQGIRKVSEVRIGANTWLGQNAVVLPGATIGRHCIIGANSVVNSDIPDYCVVAGVPARVIRKYNPDKECWEWI